jgi:hypothetical protein
LSHTINSLIYSLISNFDKLTVKKCDTTPHLYFKKTCEKLYEIGLLELYDLENYIPEIYEDRYINNMLLVYYDIPLQNKKEAEEYKFP